MKDYILNGEDILEILKTGKFDEEKYQGKLMVYGISTEDVLSNNDLEITKENVEKAYGLTVDDEIVDDIWQDIYKKMEENLMTKTDIIDFLKQEAKKRNILEENLKEEFEKINQGDTVVLVSYAGASWSIEDENKNEVIIDEDVLDEMVSD